MNLTKLEATCPDGGGIDNDIVVQSIVTQMHADVSKAVTVWGATAR